MLTHVNKKEPEKPIIIQAATNALTPVRIRQKYALLLYKFNIRPINIFAIHNLI